MLSVSVILEVKRLLDLGTMSQRKIAKCVGVSRGTVGAIARGERGLHGQEPAMQYDKEFQLYQGFPERCPSCGGMVYFPCILCKVRRRLQLQTARRDRETIRQNVA